MDSTLLETAKELFSLIDVQQKGYILKDELSQISDYDSVFSVLDREGEGKITLDDFAAAFIAHRQNDDEEYKQCADEELSVACTGPAREECFPRSTHCDNDSSINSSDSKTNNETHPSVGRQDYVETTGLGLISSNSENCPTNTNYSQMLGENCRESDDVFEGEGLHADTQTFGNSPSKSPYLRSSSLHKRRRTTSSEPRPSDSIGPEITDRSPPDGNEEDNHKHRQSPRRSRRSVTSDKQKSVKTQVCIPGSGFAKDAILDVLKIVDSHTIANLGLYDNGKAAWRCNGGVDSSNVFASRDSVGTWPSMAENVDSLNNEVSAKSRECFCCEYDTAEPQLDGKEVCSDCYYTRANSRGACLQSGAASNCTSDEGTDDSRLGMFSPSSGCSDQAFSLETHSEYDTAQQMEGGDSNGNIFKFEDRSPLKGSEYNRSSANLDKESIGNLIFEDDCGKREYLYDRILSVTGVRLNSRISSSESSLHDLILEAEVAKKSAALVEDWDSVMKRINGVSVFGGNQVIRYLWQQLSVYNTDLLQPFEDFLKSVVADFNRAYSKCHELETQLHSKAEQHEREVTRVYDDMEHLLSREKEQALKDLTEREDYLRSEFNRIIHMKDTDITDALRCKADIDAKLEKMQEECHSLKITKEKLEKQLSISNASEAQVRSENDYLTQENRSLTEKLMKYVHDTDEMQDKLISLSKVAEASKENYRRCYRKYQDALEEKEYFDMNVSNLTQELQDLRSANRSLKDRIENNMSTTISWRDGQVSPRLQQSPEPNEKRGPRASGFPNGIMPISQSNRNSHVSEPSFDESTPDITVRSTQILPVPDVVPSRTRPINSPPKGASTPVKVTILTRKVEKAAKETIPATVVHHTGQEYKVIFVGDAAVGKTSLIRKISRGTFSSRRESTASPDFVKKTVIVKNRSVTLNIWDTVGQERCSYILKVEGFAQQLSFRFNSLPPSYFRKADVVVLVYDIIEKVSFLNVKSWIKTIYEHTDENILLVLCGNKSDLDHRRQVKEDRALKLAKVNDAIYLESSAKTGYNVAGLCEIIASTLLERDETVFIRETSVATLHQDLLGVSRTSMKSCC